jgi:hypothetical protein
LRKGKIKGKASLSVEKHLSLVKLETRPHRVVAQENWGLTDEQMRGKHVHHRVAVSKGGTNDPSNLFVCSPSMHRWGWHQGDRGFGEWAHEGYRQAVEMGRHEGWGYVPRETLAENGRRTSAKLIAKKRGIHGATPEQRSAWNKVNGAKGCQAAGRSTFEKGVGLFAMTEDEKVARNRKGASVINGIQWMCLETGHLSTSGPLAKWQKKRGIDPARRVRLMPEESAFIFVWA